MTIFLLVSLHVEQPDSERSALEECIAVLRGRSEAASRLQGGAPHLEEELQIFRDWLETSDHLLGQAPVQLAEPPSDEGNEHQVWFLEETHTFLKATWPGFFGLKVIQRPDESDRASPIDYLERWHLHNQLFGDRIAFIGAVETERGLRLIIEQPAIAGSPATEEEIRAFFTGNEWLPFRVGDETAYLDPASEVAISDTHRGNIVRMEGGLLAPIDLRVQKLTGSLLDAVKELCNA